MNDNIFSLAAQVPVLLLGPPGIGKTAAITAFAESLGADLIDIRLSAETPSSFEGKDYIAPQSGTLKKARAWWLERLDRNKEENRPSVLFFDEYTNAPDALQQLAYAPFNERKLHGVSFDYTIQRADSQWPGLYVFAAGNRVEDETGAREVVYATKTRVFTVDFSVSAEEWLVWAEENGVDARILAFIQANPDALIEKPSTGTACPREWVNLSLALRAGIPFREAAHGTVRGAHEAKFCAFFEDAALCPTPEDIAQGRARTPSKVHLAAYTAVLARALKSHAEPTRYFPLVYRWIAAQSEECEIIFARMAIALLREKLVSDKECLTVLASAAKKTGMHVW